VAIVIYVNDYERHSIQAQLAVPPAMETNMTKLKGRIALVAGASSTSRSAV
jgi:hypothetical protein